MSKHARLESTILRATAQILREEVKDPAIGFVTLTAVKLAKDLSNLSIYYTVLNDDNKKLTEKALTRSKPFIRGAIGRHVKMRKVPNIGFIYDESLSYGNKIESGLKAVLQDDEEK